MPRHRGSATSFFTLNQFYLVFTFGWLVDWLILFVLKFWYVKSMYVSRSDYGSPLEYPFLERTKRNKDISKKSREYFRGPCNL